MTRPKVDPDKRKRIANACDICKRRKQKCDGQQPCSTCVKKQVTCAYDNVSPRDHEQSPSAAPSQKRVRRQPRSLDESIVLAGQDDSNYTGDFSPGQSNGNVTASGDALLRSSNDGGPGRKMATDHDSTGSAEEEMDNHTMTRLLADGSGRLVYIGDSASLSFLQMLRMIVETVAGPTSFSSDPGRHTLTESKLSPLPNAQLTHLLPPKETSIILVNAFFVYTHGLLHVFDEANFAATLNDVYSDPLNVDHVFLGHLNLVLAIGCCLAAPKPGSPEALIVENLRSRSPDQSEVFYWNARSFHKATTDLEDGNVGSLQALLLMAVYMLYRSKRNTSYSYIGMAVRTAYALGMHREEILAIFPTDEQESRKRLWRSLFIMDRFLAAYLGRPVAIMEDECSGSLLSPNANISANFSQLRPDQIRSAGVEATMRSARMVGLILRKVYLKRRISIRLALELADECKRWPENLPPALHWRQASPNDLPQALSILHCNLAYCQSIILLSRPFFLYLLRLEVQSTRPASKPGAKSRGKMEKFSDACVIASIHLIALVQKAFEGGYFAKVDSFATYSLFSAALVLFANGFARPSSVALSSQSMANAISILSCCGEMDPQAERGAHILGEFRGVIQQRTQQSAFHLPDSAFQASLPAVVPNLNDQNSFIPTLQGGFMPLSRISGENSASSFGNIPGAANGFSSVAPVPSFLVNHDALSGLLDVTNTVLPTLSDTDSLEFDQPIDFDALCGWWPGSVPTSGLGTSGGTGGQSGNYAMTGMGPTSGMSIL